MRWAFFTILSMVLAAFSAYANDAELYDPAPPADAAFVRVINAMEGKEVKASIGATNFGKYQTAAISNYRILKAGDYDVTFGDIKQSVTINAGNYQTVVLNNAGNILVFNDELLENPTKARVYFYNLSDAANASVIAPEHGAAVVENIAPDNTASRAMNALKVTLQVKAGASAVQDFADVQLKRRIGTSFLLTGKEGGYNAIMIKNEVER
jgi:alginate O-acetyltransferase complex protein AlgF